MRFGIPSRARVGWPDYSSHANVPPSTAESQSSVCVCVSFGRRGGSWSQLLPVSAKNHTAAIWMRLRLHNVAALLQPSLSRQAWPSEPRPLPSAPVPDPPCPSSPPLRTSGTLQVLDTAHVNTLVCACVCVCSHCLCHQNSLDGAVLTRRFQCGQIPLWCAGPLISLCMASWADYKIIRGMFIAALWTCRNASNKNI